MTRNKIASVVLTALIFISAGCSKPSANTTPPAQPATSTAAAPAQKASAKTPPSAKVIPVPTDWVQMSDEEKGYGFKVPDGTQSKTENVNGVDIFMAKTPDPSSVSAIVMAFKDKTTSKEDLLKFASDVLEGMEEKDVKVTDVVELSDDYSLGMISFVDKDGKVTKGKVLVATDVTDNYVMLLGTDEKEYAANEKIIDEIWGSFSMRSGGYSGNS
ncbi:MAG TPA: hypothetical protein VI756_17485 [Blastocatellia bacterium]